MAYFRFASLTHSDQISYAFDSGGYSTRDNALAAWAHAYDTYGHGMTQHGPEYLVGIDKMTDFLRSLAIHVAKPENREDLAVLSREWTDHDCVKDTCKFLMTIEHVPYNSEDKKTWKRKYFNINERKTSSAESKRHDKRWDEITSGMDGSLGFCLWQLTNNHYVRGYISRLALLLKVMEVFDSESKHYGRHDLPMKQFGFDPDGDRDIYWKGKDRLEAAFRAVNELVKAHKCHEYANRVIESWEHDSLKPVEISTEAS
jgi:hypothetical protein